MDVVFSVIRVPNGHRAWFEFCKSLDEYGGDLFSHIYVAPSAVSGTFVDNARSRAWRTASSLSAPRPEEVLWMDNPYHRLKLRSRKAAHLFRDWSLKNVRKPMAGPL